MFDAGVTLEELARLAPGPELAAVLARVDRSVLNGYELVEVAKATSRQVAHYQGELLATVRETAYCPPGDHTSSPERTDRPHDYTADEIRWALTLTRRAADALLGAAYTLVERIPAAHRALRSGAIDLLDSLAHAAKRAGDARTLDELRADLYLGILNGDHLPAPAPAAGRGGVEIVVPLATLAGVSDEPGHLDGWGPVLAEIARKMAHQQLDRPWRFSVYDRDGVLAGHGRLRRRPSAGDAGFVKARDRTCRAPGCRTPAHRSDLDHTHAWEDGGATVPANLGVLCRHCHGYKHSDGVHLTQPTPGTFVWRSRLGHTYVTQPEPP